MNSHNIWIGGGVEDKKKCCLAKVSFAEKMYKQIATSCTLLPLQNKFNLLKIKNINYCNIINIGENSSFTLRHWQDVHASVGTWDFYWK